jgi:hypothetical protein
MRDIVKRFFWVSIYAIAMALLEAVVVAYLRQLLEIRASHVSLGPLLPMEIGREVATLAMLIAIGWLAGSEGTSRWAYGLYAFGLWDIFYYVWLWVLLDWPQTLLDWDVLFLIPFTWWGPVLAPVLIAALICTSAVLVMVRSARGRQPEITPARLVLVVLGGALALYVFMADSLHAWLAGRPDWATLRPSEPFNWPLFLIALALMAVPSLLAAWPLVRAGPQSGTTRRSVVRREQGM